MTDLKCASLDTFYQYSLEKSILIQSPLVIILIFYFIFSMKFVLLHCKKREKQIGNMNYTNYLHSFSYFLQGLVMYFTETYQRAWMILAKIQSPVLCLPVHDEMFTHI